MSAVVKDMLVAAKEARRQASEDYGQVIVAAKEAGWSNTEIARVLGTTEGAVRMYLKRHPELEHMREVVTVPA